jgi:hypothetical protein
MKATSYERHVLKSKLMNHFESKGIKTEGTNSSEICLFSTVALNAKSIKLKGGTFITSWGVAGALKEIGRSEIFA